MADEVRERVVLGAIDYNQPEELRNRDIYVFGVCRGHSTAAYLRFLNEKQIKFKRILGFDSFEGLPLEEPGVIPYNGYRPGAFSAAAAFGIKNPDAVARIIKQALTIYPNADRVELVPGYYEKTLTSELVSERLMKPALFVEMDVDLYVSAKQALQFLGANGLVAEGTILYYDDWGATEEYAGGESRAHREWAEKFGIECQELYDTGCYAELHRQKIFRVRKVAK